LSILKTLIRSNKTFISSLVILQTNLHLLYITGLLSQETAAQGHRRDEVLGGYGQQAVTAPVTRIVCFALGSLGLSEDSIVQHLAAFTIARELGKMYKRAGIPVDERIEIFGQSPVYTPSDIKTLTCFKPLITVLDDPEAFLAIMNVLEVMARKAVAGVFAEDPSARPAAMF
jgi:hypothetical protein